MAMLPAVLFKLRAADDMFKSSACAELKNQANILVMPIQITYLVNRNKYFKLLQSQYGIFVQKKCQSGKGC